MQIFNKQMTKLFSSFLSIHKITFSQKNKNGNIIQVIREVLFRPRSVVFLIVVDPNNGKCLYVKQMRAGVIADNFNVPCIEPIAGIIDKGETPEEAAVREAKEEVNIDLKVSDLKMVSEGYLSPGISNEYAYFFKAYFDSETYNTGSFGVESENEVIESVILTSDQVNQLLLNNDCFISAATIISQQISKNYQALI